MVATHYDVKVDLYRIDRSHPFSPFGGGIEVECAVTLRNIAPGLVSSVRFILHRLLRVRDVSLADGTRVPFTSALFDFEGTENLQVRVLEVLLASPVLPGEAVTLRLSYDGAVAGHCEAWVYCKDSVNRDFTLLREDVLWYPVAAPPSRDGWHSVSGLSEGYTYDLEVRVPFDLMREPFAVTAGGLVSAETSGSSAVFRYRCETPSHRIDLAVANYRRFQDKAGWIAAYCLPGDEAGAQKAIWVAEKTMELCEKWLGPGRGGRLAIAEIPDYWGSQSSPLFIMQERRAFVSQEESGGQPAGGTGLPRPEWRPLYLIGHEVAHLWSVNSREPVSSRWLDEGMTHFVEALLLREVYGEEAFRWRMDSYARGFDSAPKEARSQPICGNTMPEFTDHLSRGKGPRALQALSDLVGLDITLDIMRRFTQRFLGSC
jgi:hypothetical protein